MTPSKPWLAHQAIAAPLQVKQTADTLTWSDTATNSARYYVVYKGAGTAEEIIANPANIVTKIWSGDGLEFSYPISETGTYVVTALDAASNESAPIIAQIPGADVTVLYQDENGGEIAPSETLQGNIGENFAAEIKVIAGYTKKDAQVTGTFTDQAQTVVVSYTKDPEEVVLPTEPDPEPTPKPEPKPTPDPAPKPDGTIVIPPEKEIVPQQPEKAPSLEKVAPKSEPSKEKGLLPTTGDKSTDLAIVLGLVLSMTGVLVLLRWKRRQV